MTIREALAEGSAALKDSGIESFSLDASLLLAEITGLSRAGLIASGSDPLAKESVEQFRELIEQRRSGLCVAYLLGRKEFFALDFAVNPSVLVPRPDTETLVEAALNQLEKRKEKKNTAPLRVLDLCTGSGAVAIALKHEMPELEVWASDISDAALECAKSNAARLLPLHDAPIRFLQGNLFEALLPHSQHSSFELIVGNPPYIPSDEIASLAPEVQHEPRLALDGGSDGLDLIRAIVAAAPDYLCPDGTLLLEAESRQMDAISPLMRDAGFSDVQIFSDLSGQQRVIGAYLRPAECGTVYGVLAL